MNQFSEPEHIAILRNTLRQFIDKEMPRDKVNPVSYTHLTLPTNREV